MASSVPIPSFFKVLVDDFSEELKIPTAYVKHLNGLAACKLKGPNGKCWDVKVEEKDDDSLFFQRGWKKFVKDNFLEVGDFLIFYFDGKSRFDVKIYDKSACEMDLEEAKTKRRGALAGESSNFIIPRDTGNVEFNSEYSCFKKTMATHRKYQMQIPTAIARAKGLAAQNIELRDPRNRTWSVRLTHTPDGHVTMRRSWGDCCKANQIEVGDTVVIEFVRQHARVHIFKHEEGDVVLRGPNVVN